MSTVTDIRSEEEFSTLLETTSPSTLLVLNFYTPWIRFCTAVNEILSTIVSQYPISASQAISFISVNGKDFSDIAKRYSVSVAPWIICIQNGDILESVRGSDCNNIRNAIHRHAPSGVSVESKEATYARLTELVKAAPVMVFMKGTPKSPSCRFSQHLANLLRDHNISYDSFDVLNDQNVRQGLKEFANWPTFPKLWVDGKLVHNEFNSDSKFLSRYSACKAVA